MVDNTAPTVTIGGVPATSTAQILVSNSGASVTNTGATSILAQSITTGDHRHGYTVSQIEINIFSFEESRRTTVKLYSNSNNGQPQDLVATLVNPLTFTGGFNTFTAPPGTTLSRNTTYWIVLNEDISDVSSDRVGYTTTTSKADTSSYGWSIGDKRLHKLLQTGSWGTSTFSVIPLTVKGNLTSGSSPEFDDASLTRSIAENTAADVNVGAVIPAATDTDSGDTLTYTMEGTDAASFNFNATTRQITTKAGVTYDFETKSSYSVTIKVEDNNGDSDTVAVTITLTDVNEPPSAPGAPTVAATSGSTTSLDVSWTAPSNSGKPAIASYDLQYRAGASGNFTDGPQDVTGTSTTIASLNSGTSYQVQVRATNDEGDSGWSGSGSGSTSATTPMMTGATTFISNTGQASTIVSSSLRATAFTTGVGTYTLSSVAIAVDAQSGTPIPVVQIYGDTSGLPGTLVATMTNPATIADNAINIFTAPANTTLAASTTYWVTTSNSAATTGTGFIVIVINNASPDSGAAAGWSIGNALWKAVATNPWGPTQNRHRFQIRGTAQTTTPTNNAPEFADASLTRSIAENTAADANVGAVIPAATDTDIGDTLTYTMEGTDAAIVQLQRNDAPDHHESGRDLRF